MNRIIAIIVVAVVFAAIIRWPVDPFAVGATIRNCEQAWIETHLFRVATPIRCGGPG